MSLKYAVEKQSPNHYVLPRLGDMKVDAHAFFSEALYASGEPALPGPVHEVSQELEGIGPARAFFTEIADVAGPQPPLPDPSWPRRIGRTLDVAGRGMPYMLGLKRRRRLAQGT